jgi:hypothetical protein
MPVVAVAAKRRSNKMTESLARLAACEREIAELKTENERLRGQLSMFDPHHSLKEALPSYDEAAQLFTKITTIYRNMRVPGEEREQIEGLRCGMAYLFGTCARTETPTTKYDGSWWIGNCRDWLSAARLYGRPRTLVACIIATNAVPFVLNHNEVFLDPFGRGTPIDRTRWKLLLRGDALPEPMRIERKLNESIGPVRQMGVSW